MLEEELRSEDIKPRLLGHWGTCPGINFVYANLNFSIKKHGLNMLFVLGPGHGFPALQANLFLEGTLQKYYPEATLDERGLEYISRNFSWPYGFPSHSNPGAPGSILEGGELGYSLSTAYGAVLDNPDLTVACLIGDGEAETGPLSTSWHLNKFIDPKTSGSVLPILHLNGYKISGPTVFGRMSQFELKSLFEGYGYEPFFVEEIPGEDVFRKMQEVLDKCFLKIKNIKAKAQTGELTSPNFPMIILKTPKGWTGPKEHDGKKLEGNNLSHQVPLTNVKTDTEELQLLNNWLKSYSFTSLFDKNQGLISELQQIIPEEGKRMGENNSAFPGRIYKELVLPNPKDFAEEPETPGEIGSSSMRRTGEFLNAVFKLNEPRNFRLFSPDETYSNKLDKVFDSTKRAFEWPTAKWDQDMAKDGGVIEMLSEHSLFGLLQGYILTGRHGIFASYEAFVQIVSSMADQYSKFIRVARDIEWRGDFASLNIILTSSGWRQDHNGFSHQNPGFISDMLEKQDGNIKVYFPADGNSTLAVINKSLQSKKGINIIVAGKTQEPRWLTYDQAAKELEAGLSIWDFASDENPDIVFCGVGDYVTKECLAAISILKQETTAKARFVNVVDPSSLYNTAFNEFFTEDKQIIFNFHGYPESLMKILFLDRKDTERFEVRGYIENGSTTTPFDMHIRNRTSRWHLFMDALPKLVKAGVIPQGSAETLIQKYNRKIEEHKKYIIENGVDLPEVEGWKW